MSKAKEQGKAAETLGPTTAGGVDPAAPQVDAGTWLGVVLALVKSLYVDIGRLAMTGAMFDRCFDDKPTGNAPERIIRAIIKSRLGMIDAKRAANPAYKGLACSAAWVVIHAQAGITLRGEKGEVVHAGPLLLTLGDVQPVIERMAAENPTEYTCHVAGLRGLQLPVSTPEVSTIAGAKTDYRAPRDCKVFIAKVAYMANRRTKATSAAAAAYADF